jgi:hypothetical protein
VNREREGYFCSTCGAGYYDEEQLLEHARQLHEWRPSVVREVVLASSERGPVAVAADADARSALAP